MDLWKNRFVCLKLKVTICALSFPVKKLPQWYLYMASYMLSSFSIQIGTSLAELFVLPKVNSFFVCG